MYIYHRGDSVYIHGFCFFALFPLKENKNKQKKLPGGHFLIFLCRSIFQFLIIFFFPLMIWGLMELITYNVFMLQGPEPTGSQQLLSQKKHTLSHCTLNFFLGCLPWNVCLFFPPTCDATDCIVIEKVGCNKKKKKNSAWPSLFDSTRNAATSVALLQLIAVQLLHWEEWRRQL